MEMTDVQKAAAYYKSVAMQSRPDAKPPFVPCRVQLKKRVRGDWPVGHAAQAGPGEFECESNAYGAVSVLAENGTNLGLRLDEFEPIAWTPNPHAVAGT